jgi:cellulose synthase/poly-beta-1,6-N-acetylglucosamine synthase-like glycosyltransferase
MGLFADLLIVSTAVYTGVALLFFLGLCRTRLNKSFPDQPFISVVIAARNEADFITSCLDSLSRQTYPADRFEILVVDDASHDNTATLVNTWIQKLPNLKLLKVGQAFSDMAAKKRPMSVGICHARGEWITTTDADCTVPPTWLFSLATHMHPDVGVVIGFSQIKTAKTQLTFFERLQAFDFLSLMAAAAGAVGLGFPLAATGQNLSYRKSLFDKVGGFKTIGHRPSGDDVLLLQLLRKAWTGRILFATRPDTYVSTWRTETPISFFRQRCRWASNAAYQLKLNPVFFIYILSVFLTNALIFLGLLWDGTTGDRSLPVVCFLLKIMADLLVVGQGARLFKRQELLFVLPVWELFQLPYTLFMGIAGTLGKFTWKGRRHT